MAKNRSWTSQDVQDFYTLTEYTEATRAFQSGALQRLLTPYDRKEIEDIIGDTSNLGTTKEERYNNYLKKIKENSFCYWLFKNDEFKKAHALFKEKSRRKKNAGYHIECVELRFLRCAAIVGLYILFKDSGNQRPNPDSRQVTQAINNVKKLQNSLTVGVRLNDYLKTQQLTRLLAELIDTLKSTKRKPRSDKNSTGRQFVAVVSGQLLESFGEASPGIVTHLAAVLGYAPDNTAIQGQLRSARKKHKEAKRAAAIAKVTDALIKAPKKTA